MYRTTTGIITLAIVLFAGAHGAESVGADYIIDARILAAPVGGAEDVKVIGAKIRKGPGEDDPAVLGSPSEIRIDDLKLTFDDTGSLLWNGGTEPPDDTGVELLTAPRLLTSAGKQAMVVKAARLQYFTKEADGSYRLRNTEPESAPGIEFGCTVEPAGEGQVNLDYELKLVLLEGREKLHGVGLDVGRPILRTRHFTSRLQLALDHWSLVSGQMVEDASGGEGDALLILLRVRER